MARSSSVDSFPCYVAESAVVSVTAENSRATPTATLVLRIAGLTMTRFIAHSTRLGSIVLLLIGCSLESTQPSASNSPAAQSGGKSSSAKSDSSNESGGADTDGADSGGRENGGTSATGRSSTKTAASSTGGAHSSGGASAKSSAASKSAGGSLAISGSVAKGGNAASGSGTGGTGGIVVSSTHAELCAWEQGPSATNGGLTCYWFSQGTSKDEKTCPGGYKTYCGYCGSETGEKPQSGQIWCPINHIVSTVQNIATPHFVAIPPGPLGQGKNCGACVEVTYRNRSIVATVIDSCPSCLNDEHIDLSLSAAKALGMNEMIGQVESGVTWRIVGCPTTSDIVVGFNGGYKGQVYFQNAAFPIASAKSGNTEASVNTGFWDFGKEMGGQEVTLTDVMGHTITATIPADGGPLGAQFDLTCQ
jgi:hypothetical protein